MLQSFALEQCFDLFYITFSWTFLEFRNWNAPKNVKLRAEMIANCTFPYNVLANSSRNGQCLSESRWVGVTFLWTVRSAWFRRRTFHVRIQCIRFDSWKVRHLNLSLVKFLISPFRSLHEVIFHATGSRFCFVVSLVYVRVVTWYIRDPLIPIFLPLFWSLSPFFPKILIPEPW